MTQHGSTPDDSRETENSTGMGPSASLLTDPTTNDVRLGAEDLYPTLEFGSAALAGAVRRLGEATEHIQQALDALAEGDEFSADDHVLQLRVVLSEAFKNYEVSEGLGIGLASILWGLFNLGRQPATQRQLLVLRQVTGRLKREPFMTSEEAATLTGTLEDVGMNLDPPALAVISDVLEG